MSARFRVVVVGLGVQGPKRIAAAGGDVVATVDPVKPGATHRRIADVPADLYDAALVCTPDVAKPDLLADLVALGKHVLVEKPLPLQPTADLVALKERAEARGLVVYTAYNHRFEPHFVRMRQALTSGVLGRVYRARLFYGNGTARLVRDSAWRDTGTGVLPDLGSHLLDTVQFWFGVRPTGLRPTLARAYENRAFDHVVLTADGEPDIELEMTLLSWRNHFTADVFAEKGSAHISSLCKWGPAQFTLRTRMLPSGAPPEETVTLVQPDPTWVLEYEHFKALCLSGGRGNLENDIWMNDVFTDLTARTGAMPA